MDVEEIALPGIGLRYDFATRSGQRVGVVCHRNGRRDLVIYDLDDKQVVCSYFIFERGRVVRCNDFASLSWPV